MLFLFLFLFADCRPPLIQVLKTMQGIRHVLTERHYARDGAVKLAETDPEVNLSGDGPAYGPLVYLEEEIMEEALLEEELQEPAEPAESPDTQQKAAPESAVDASSAPPSPKPSGQEPPKV